MTATRLRPDRRLRSIGRGRLLLGGQPFRLVRLQAAGAELVQRWFAGEPVDPARPGAAALRDRLVDGGLAHPVPAEHAALDRLAHGAVVVPVKDDPEGLDRTLHALGGGDVPVRTVVVDDGSERPVAVDDRLPIELIRRDDAGGPAAARNEGIRRLLEGGGPTPHWIALVDSGVEIEPADLARLVESFDDPQTVGVAPRVRSIPGAGSIADYEHHHSPLDLGPDPGPIGPGRHISHVPTATLVLRCSALPPRSGPATAGPFDEELRFGEDVDLEWRLAGSGARLRYRPDVVVHHPPRPDAASFVRQRLGYGSAAAPLADRHGDAVAPLRWSPATAVVAGGLTVALAVRGSFTSPLRVLGLLATVAGPTHTTRVLASTLDLGHDALAEAATLAAVAHGRTLRNIAEVAVRSWWPITALALLVPATRRPASAALLAGALRRGPRPTTVALGLLDDLSYGTGVWVGARRSRSLRALRPARWG